jgi:putative membrane protein insertion efficiency factor
MMIGRAAQSAVIGLIYLYRWTLGPLLGGQCRYHPTCSAYGLDAVREWGAVRGSWMAVKRIARCHPWAKGGFDPVPAKGQENTQIKTQNSELKI